eukprot:6523521-Pyramimonas_sp.AAC.1
MAREWRGICPMLRGNVLLLACAPPASSSPPPLLTELLEAAFAYPVCQRVTRREGGRMHSRRLRQSDEGRGRGLGERTGPSSTIRSSSGTTPSSHTCTGGWIHRQRGWIHRHRGWIYRQRGWIHRQRGR